MRRISGTTIVLLLCVSACRGAHESGSTGNAPASSAAPETPPIAIHAGERIGWTQAASDVSQYRFVLYVDGGSDTKDLPDARCTRTGANSFDCQAALPKLTPGKHQLQVGAMTTVENKVVEGAKSDPFMVLVTDDARSDRPR